MADNAKRLAGPTQPGTGATDIYTVPAATAGVIRNIHIANTTDSDAWLSLSIGASGVDSAASRFFDKVSVPGQGANSHGIIDWSGFLVLAAGEVLVAKQGTSGALTITVSGVEVT